MIIILKILLSVKLLVVRNSKSDAIRRNNYWIERVNNPNCYVRYVAVWSLVEIIERKPNIAIEVFIGVKELIINSNIDKLY